MRGWSIFSPQPAIKKVNDLLVNTLVAAPMAMLVAYYRPNHLRHHGGFGSDTDPCFHREVMKRRGYARGTSLVRRVVAAARSLPGLNVEFYNTQLASGGTTPLIAFIPWHALFWWLPLAVLFGPLGIGYWLLLWAIPMIATLPVIRALAEADEHDYNRADDELGCSFTNDSWIARVIIHPAGDAWHAAHHMRMTVPAWKLSSFHQFMLGASIEFRSQIHFGPEIAAVA
jgi:fatty acid desaturase